MKFSSSVARRKQPRRPWCMSKSTPVTVLLSLFAGCAQPITRSADEAMPLSAAPDLDAQERALIDAAILLIENQKLLPLVEELQALGHEPAPQLVAETIQRVLTR